MVELLIRVNGAFSHHGRVHGEKLSLILLSPKLDSWFFCFIGKIAPMGTVPSQSFVPGIGTMERESDGVPIVETHCVPNYKVRMAEQEDVTVLHPVEQIRTLVGRCEALIILFRKVDR